MTKSKVIIAITAVILNLGLITGVKAAEATDTYWEMNLLPAKVSNTDDDHWNTYGGYGGHVSLERIVGGPSYYAQLKAVNAYNESRSDYALCLQGDGNVSLSGISMEDGWDYKVKAYNYAFETSYRWAYGGFDW